MPCPSATEFMKNLWSTVSLTGRPAVAEVSIVRLAKRCKYIRGQNIWRKGLNTRVD